MTDQAVWMGLHVFAWKRIITIGQTILGGAILIDLIRAGDKQRFLEMSAALKERSESIPPVYAISNKPLFKWAAVIIPIIAVLVVSVLWVRSGVPFDATFFGAVFLLIFLQSLCLIPLTVIINVSVAIWALLRTAQKFGPIAFHWVLHQLGFDLSLRLFIFILLVALSVIQLRIS